MYLILLVTKGEDDGSVDGIGGLQVVMVAGFAAVVPGSWAVGFAASSPLFAVVVLEVVCCVFRGVVGCCCR